MDLTEGLETSAKLNLTPGKCPKENIHHLRLLSLKSNNRTPLCMVWQVVLCWSDVLCTITTKLWSCVCSITLLSCHNAKAYKTKDIDEHRNNPNSIQFEQFRYLGLEKVMTMTINISVFWHVSSCDLNKIRSRANLNPCTNIFD
jgi:hypothetical protein